MRTLFKKHNLMCSIIADSTRLGEPRILQVSFSYSVRTVLTIISVVIWKLPVIVQVRKELSSVLSVTISSEMELEISDRYILFSLAAAVAADCWGDGWSE